MATKTVMFHGREDKFNPKLINLNTTFMTIYQPGPRRVVSRIIEPKCSVDCEIAATHSPDQVDNWPSRNNLCKTVIN